MSYCICSTKQVYRGIQPMKNNSKYFMKQIRPMPLQRILKIVKKEIHSGLHLSTVQRHDKSIWKDPGGYSTGIMIYNSLTKSKVPLKTIEPNLLTWYNCGPTVYDSAHIGHGLTYVRLDIMRRILERFFKIQVIQVSNITDIDDKIIFRARQLNENYKSLAERFEAEFREDMSKLNVTPPSISPRVTEYIPQIISFVQNLIQKGFAYPINGSVYFDTHSYKGYGKFKQMNEEKNIIRVRNDFKRCPNDFALWKGSLEAPFWSSPWGTGRPGWHIECSAMAYQIFGTKLDLHSGGIDLRFPHHENEDAQCCAHHDTDQWCNYWMHTGHLNVKGSVKMSKSLKNTISIDQFLDKHPANLFRLYCLLSHYRRHLDYTDDVLHKTENQMNKIVSFLQFSHGYLTSQMACGSIDDVAIMQKMSEVKCEVERCFANDFNTEGAVHQVLDLIKVCNKHLTKTSKVVGAPRSLSTVSLVSDYIFDFFQTLGIQFKSYVPKANYVIGEDQRFASVMDATVRFRHGVKNFALLQGDQAVKELNREEIKEVQASRRPLMESCDNLRSRIKANGITILDHGGASSWSFSESNTGPNVNAATKTDQKRTKKS